MAERAPTPSEQARRLALVTGGSSGIGLEIARVLARRGYHTVLVARRLPALERAARELSHHAPSRAVSLDLADAGFAAEFTKLAASIGPVDVLINCAGHGLYKPFLDLEPGEDHGLIQVHYFASAAAIRAVLPSMLDRQRGHVINVGSMSAKIGPWGHSAYAAAKAALGALTESLAAEHRGSGVHFSIVHPGIVDTPFYRQPSFAPLRRRTERWLIPAHRVAGAVLDLIDRPRLEVCVPRCYRVVDAVGALSPGLLHRLVARQSMAGDVRARDAAAPRSRPEETA